MPAAAMDMSKSTGNSVVCQSHQTAAESVFARVLQLVQANDLADSSRQEWLKRNSTILDVQEEVRKAQDKYNIRTQGRARKWLARFSGSVLNYGQILDVLVQHHPEYVSLAWGTTKLFFVLFQNHEELLTGLAKILTKVSEALPQIEIQLDLYKEPRLQQAAENVYGVLIELFHEIVKFYEESPLKHAWKSFSQPLSVRFAPLISTIDEQSRCMSKIVSLLAKRELRSMHERQQQMETQITLMGKDMSAMAAALSSLADNFTSSQSIPKAILSIVSDLQAAKMISGTQSKDFSEPTATLELRLAFCWRQQVRHGKNIDELWVSLSLKHWSCSKSSAVILIQAFTKKDVERMLLGTAMVDYIRQSPIPVLWALQSPGSPKYAAASSVQLLKHLVAQALEFRSSSVSNHVSDNFNATRIASAHTAEQWAEILKYALSSIPLVYIVIDLDLLDQKDEFQNNVAHLFSSIIHLVEICKPTRLKFALISRGRIPPSDHGLAGTAVVNADNELSPSNRSSTRRTGRRLGARVQRGRGRGALAFRAQLG